VLVILYGVSQCRSSLGCGAVRTAAPRTNVLLRLSSVGLGSSDGRVHDGVVRAKRAVRRSVAEDA
jgi:hypothetical protein